MLPPNKLHSYVSHRFVLNGSSSNWYSFDCPFCPHGKGKNKMAIHFGYQFVKCWACEYSARAMQFIMDYENEDYTTVAKKIRESVDNGIKMEYLVNMNLPSEYALNPIEPPKGFLTIMEGKGSLTNRARDYLVGRGYDLELLDMKGFGYVKTKGPFGADYFGRVIVPFKRNGRFVYYVARDFMDRGDGARYLNPPVDSVQVGKGDLWYNEDAISMYDTVYITEGWGCAETMGDNAVSSQGWSLSKAQKGILNNGNCKHLVFLPDKGFYRKALETASEFLDTKKSVKVVNMDLWPGEGKDPNAIGKENILKMVKETEPLTFEDLILISIQ